MLTELKRQSRGGRGAKAAKPLTRRGRRSSLNTRHSADEAAVLTKIKAPIARRVGREGSGAFDPARTSLQPQQTTQRGRGGGVDRVEAPIARRVGREGEAVNRARTSLQPQHTAQLGRGGGVDRE